jgi:uncharacterized protein
VLQAALVAKRETALCALRECEQGLLVALSGGVDSAVLLALAVESLGPERVRAVTGVSPAVPAVDREDASRVAAQIGVAHETLPTREMDRGAYRANLGDRCFHCRVELFDGLERLRRHYRMAAVAYGAIKDDTGDHRPGMRAAEQRGVLAPLLVAGMTKNDVRRLAADFGLTVRDKPAAACLASRIPVGTAVTRARLARVERAEGELRLQGFGQVRVRDHGETARVEFDLAGLARVADPERRRSAEHAVREAGFERVEIDPRGYRSGGAGPEAQRSVAGSGDGAGSRPARDGGQ